MPLNQYQLNILRDRRSEEWIYGLKFLSLTTGAGYSALDAYRKQNWVETNSFFSGALLWNPFSAKNQSESGFYKISDIIIVCSRDNRSTAQAKDVKVEYDGIKFRVNRVVDCPDSEELVITASRLE